MKVWGPAATLGFAILSIAIGIVIFAFVRSGIPALAALDLLRNGTAVAIGILIGYPVQTVTLVLAVHLTGTGILTYFGLMIPRWRSAAVAVAALAGLSRHPINAAAVAAFTAPSSPITVGQCRTGSRVALALRCLSRGRWPHPRSRRW